jgi:hypothetical protein
MEDQDELIKNNLTDYSQEESFLSNNKDNIINEDDYEEELNIIDNPIDKKNQEENKFNFNFCFNYNNVNNQFIQRGFSDMHNTHHNNESNNIPFNNNGLNNNFIQRNTFNDSIPNKIFGNNFINMNNNYINLLPNSKGQHPNDSLFNNFPFKSNYETTPNKLNNNCNYTNNINPNNYTNDSANRNAYNFFFNNTNNNSTNNKNNSSMMNYNIFDMINADSSLIFNYFNKLNLNQNSQDEYGCKNGNRLSSYYQYKLFDFNGENINLENLNYDYNKEKVQLFKDDELEKEKYNIAKTIDEESIEEKRENESFFGPHRGKNKKFLFIIISIKLLIYVNYLN